MYFLKNIFVFSCLLMTVCFSKIHSQQDPVSIPGDPFSEFGNFETTQEEEDIERFYAYGRFIHLSAIAGLGFPLGGMKQIYSKGLTGGVRIDFFMDWNVALESTFALGVHSLNIIYSDAGNAIEGQAYFINADIGIKYYLNFHDISNTIAYINPAIRTGAGVIVINDTSDEATVPDILGNSSGGLVPDHVQAAPEVYFGASLEIPIFYTSVYLGIECTYHLTFLPSYNDSIQFYDSDGLETEAVNYYGHLDYSGNVLNVSMSLIWNLN